MRIGIVYYIFDLCTQGERFISTFLRLLFVIETKNFGTFA